ncbi:TylF/MycF/NovP-related O-methyltransferase [Asticcacaulis sp.]|uniref:TylF/MycF/NovP-related O-methyltransferase n=1 Tax=Asticcacaulis sp. TaxID=1872648 RepID=UPI0031CE464F
MAVKLDILNSFDSNNKIVNVYNNAIMRSQNFEFDNYNKKMRFYMLHQMVEHAVKTFPNYDLVECGCWHGHSTLIISEVMRELSAKGSLHVFDSFEGLSVFEPQDASEIIPGDQQESVRSHFRSNIDHFHHITSDYSFVRAYPGWVPDLFNKVEENKFSFVSIDLDLYQPTKDAISFFYPRLVTGGFLYLDDYGYKDFPGSKMAIDEYLCDKSFQFFMEGPAGAAILIK